MSGGSYNYLGVRLPEELMALRALSDLQAMAEDLYREFPNTAAALDTRRLLLDIERIAERTAQLGKVWHGFEWWKSGDYSRDEAAGAVEEYGRQAGAETG